MMEKYVNHFTAQNLNDDEIGVLAHSADIDIIMITDIRRAHMSISMA